jgi:chromosome segregation protein
VHLKQIRVRGFKSFARVTDLVLEPGVAVVIGPNGSGKSNLAEAVMWALGEQSASSLRGGSMQDVIFAGSDGRRASGGAEVELVFDNSDGTMPLPTPEVSVARKVHRDGQTQYSINRSTCRLADVAELMSGVGLGRAAHAVIGQGRVEWFLASKPLDRRASIEEAAGLGRYKRRRERTQLKLRDTSRNLERVQDLEREVGTQLTPLRRQASAVEQLRTAQNELAELRGRLLIGELQTVDGELEGLRRQLEEAGAERAAIDAELAELEVRRVAQEESFARLLEERERRAQRLLRARVLLGRLESCTRLTEQRVRLLQELTRAGEAERDRLLAELGGRETEAADRAWPQEKERLAAALAAAATTHREAAADLAAGRRHLGEVRAEIDHAGAERESAVLRAARLGERRTALLREADDLTARGAELARLCEESAAAAASARAEADRLASESAAAEGALTAADTEDRAARDDFIAAQTRSRELAGAAAAAVAERDHVSAAIAGLRDVGDEVTGVIGRYPGVVAVAGTLSCETGYERALGAALSRLQAGVEVPAGVDPWDLLAALRGAGARLVRLVLPRAAAPAGEEADLRAATGGGADVPGTPLLTYVRGATGRVAEILAGVRVVDDLRAVPESFGGLAVTRDGAYYSPVEAELGLAGALPAAVLLERRSHLEALSRRVAGLEEELAAARASEDESRRLADQAAGRRHEASRTATAARESSQRAERRAAAADDGVRESESQLARSARECEAHRAEAAELEEEQERLDAAAAQLLLRGESLSAPLAEAEAALVDCEERHDQALAVLTRARVELEERAAAAERQAREREQAERRHAEGRSRLATLERRLAGMPPVVAVSSRLLERFAGLQRHAETLVERLGEPAEESGGLDRDGLRSVADREATLRRAADDLGERRAALQVAAARLEEKRREVAGAFDEVAAHLERARFEPPADAAEAEALVVAAERAQRRAERIGPVNPLAEAECAELGERAVFLREQRRDLERSLEELNGLIARLTERIDEDFAEVFAVIQTHFAHMMEILFPGGRGCLRILGADAEAEAGGVALDVKPGRKLGKRLSMLSGGERALAAIAFLMSLVLANPAPFYILDEVEAALDDVNIGRLVALLREYRSRTQFIIITHQKRTMEAADILYGVTMGQDGVSHVVSARMAEDEIDKEAAGQTSA